ncbi:guanine-1-methyltransferase-domain-containing protein [Phakopsora pachyrhizi]|uniref:tRNA (guanine(9)-N1)-methyltransferase n=1 Tax=Phakopsora pachyrhizi TaxID=170000 RepID=A0AAV0BQV0_PHAPC|nr:guanine-1-methyltransferase-domain-containing protein [Phakopsora pachyrhizi]
MRAAAAAAELTDLSKKQIKRQLKYKSILENRPQRRAEERIRRKAKREAARLRSEVDGVDQLNRLEKSKRVKLDKEVFESRVIFDCNFDDRMNQKDIVSLDRQLAHSYSINRKSDTRFKQLICTSFDGKLRQRLESNDYQHTRWKNFSFLSTGLEQLIGKTINSNPSETVKEEKLGEVKVDENVRGVGKDDEPLRREDKLDDPDSDRAIVLESLDPSDLIYLSGDSPNVLTDLEPGKSYIIGALVDHNRYKNICLDRANLLGIKHAQLPIDRFMSEQLKTRKILTVNQVFEILVNYLNEGNDWKKSLEKTIPIRKLNTDQQKQT